MDVRLTLPDCPVHWHIYAWASIEWVETILQFSSDSQEECESSGNTEMSFLSSSLSITKPAGPYPSFSFHLEWGPV